MAHKKQYENYIDPQYGQVTHVNVQEIRASFQKFADECMTRIPDTGAPQELYFYNSHMGAFLRALDHAKDEFVKAALAFHAKTNEPPSAQVAHVREWMAIHYPQVKFLKLDVHMQLQWTLSCSDKSSMELVYNALRVELEKHTTKVKVAMFHDQKGHNLAFAIMAV